jgi:uncharacterized protein (UPF0335 family)
VADVSTEAVGVVAGVAMFLVGIVFRMGHHAARIEQLEQWRTSIRLDMHEISDRLGLVGEELKRLTTIIEERTQRNHSSESARR